MLDPHKTLAWARAQRQRTDLSTAALQLADATILACEQLILLGADGTCRPAPTDQPETPKPPEPILP